MEGGINLHDITSKIISFRLKYLYKVLNNPNEFPLACYFLSNNLNALFNNTYETYVGTIPLFYEIVLKIYQKHNEIFHLSNCNTIYFNLIQAKKKPLNDQIKRIDENSDIPTLFRDIHENKFTTPTQKQIMYRLLFGITPTSEGLAKRHKRVFYCKFCSLEQETEGHIFFDCQTLDLIKLELIKVLKQPDNTGINLFNVIFLNMIHQESERDIYLLKLAFIAMYRDAIWTARNHATHKNYMVTANKLADMFTYKMKYLLKIFKDTEAVKSFS